MRRVRSISSPSNLLYLTTVNKMKDTTISYVFSCKLRGRHVILPELIKGFLRMMEIS